MPFEFEINEVAKVVDPLGRIGGSADVSRGWPIEMWFGVWDADALCGLHKVA